MKKNWPILSCFAEHDSPQATFFKPHKVFWQSLCKLRDQFCNTYEVVENKLSKKKATLPVEKLFFQFIEYDRPYGRIGYIIRASDIAPKDLRVTFERVKGVPERLEM